MYNFTAKFSVWFNLSLFSLVNLWANEMQHTESADTVKALLATTLVSDQLVTTSIVKPCLSCHLGADNMSRASSVGSPPTAKFRLHQRG